MSEEMTQTCDHPDRFGDWCAECETIAFKANVAASDPEIVYGALYRVLGALYSARAELENWESLSEGERKGLYHIVHYTADIWAPQIPGMPSFEEVRKEVRADAAYHALTELGERTGRYITGDEFF